MIVLIFCLKFGIHGNCKFVMSYWLGLLFSFKYFAGSIHLAICLQVFWNHWVNIYIFYLEKVNLLLNINCRDSVMLSLFFQFSVLVYFFNFQFGPMLSIHREISHSPFHLLFWGIYRTCTNLREIGVLKFHLKKHWNPQTLINLM